MWVGYLLAGAVVGHSGFGLIAENVEEIEQLAHGGALLLLLAIGILLFQDVALVPLMLLVPLLAERGQGAQRWAFFILTVNSTLFVAAVLVVRRVFAWWVAPILNDRARSCDNQ